MGRRSRPKMMLANPKTGEVFVHPSFELALDNGLDLLRPGRKDLIPVRDDWDTMVMEGTTPIGFNPESGDYEAVREFNAGGETFAPCAVAVHPPPGYVRTHHPAAEYQDIRHPDDKLKAIGQKGLPILQSTREAGGDDPRPGLPLWSYTAIGEDAQKGRVAALFVADETSRWAPDLFYQDNLDDKVAARLEQDPDNPVLQQLASCAATSLCCCAQNVFYERWEGAVPIAPACTAACLGCLSKDPEWNTPTPQRRLKFKPRPEEIARVMAHHLETADEPMMSFGQGCEGEPTMNGPVIVESVRLTREMTKRGIINVNTNGSRPETIREMALAGCSALRVSINTFDPEMYTAYYRPQDYTFDDVMRSFDVGKEMGMYVSINFLIWPGWTDRMAELDAVSQLVDDGKLHMVQLRNLCVDPGHYRTVLPPREERGLLMGMRPFVDELHRRHPELRFGTFNPRLAADWYDEVPALVG